jgi:hypothetical protein
MTARALLVVTLVAGLATTARADTSRVLVLPLTANHVIEAGAASAFDARLLVALDDTKRVVTLTLDDELECTTPKCLADAGAAAKAQAVLSISLVRETDGLTLFATLLDVATAQPSGRAEIAPLSVSELTTTAPAQIAQRLFGAPAGSAVVGIAERGRAAAAAEALSARLSALHSFLVVPAAHAGVTLTHRAEVNVTELSITRRRHHVHNYLDGVLAGTFTLVELSSNRVVFAKPVKVTVSRRARTSSDAEVTALLADAAASDWMTAFLAARTETLLKGDSK